MASSIEAIATVTVGSGGAANIEFTSIPGTYTDLNLVLSTRNNRSDVDDTMIVEFNNSSSNLSSRRLLGSGSAASSASYPSHLYYTGIGNTATSNTFDSVSLYIPNYASSNNKSVSIDSVTENNANNAYAQLTAGLWSNSAAITSIKIRPNSGTLFLQYSTATLYGIKNS